MIARGMLGNAVLADVDGIDGDGIERSGPMTLREE